MGIEARMTGGGATLRADAARLQREPLQSRCGKCLFKWNCQARREALSAAAPRPQGVASPAPAPSPCKVAPSC